MNSNGLWYLGAAILLGWVVLSMYFVMSGSPVNLPPAIMSALPYIAIGLFGVFIYAQFRRNRSIGRVSSQNILTILGIAAFVFMIAYAIYRLVAK